MNYKEFAKRHKKDFVKIIALSGFKGSGKDTVANYLSEELYAFDSVYTQIYNMAHPIKDIMESFMNIREPMYNEKDIPVQEVEYKSFDEYDSTYQGFIKESLVYWAKALKCNTYRDIVNKIGMGIRRGVYDGFWVSMAEQFIKGAIEDVTAYNWNASKTGKKDFHREVTIIPDIRYKREINLLKKLKTEGYNVEYWLVLRKEILPDWLVAGLDVRDPAQVEIIEKDFKPSIHEFEWCKMNPKFNRVITNDGTLPELYEQIDSIIKFW